MRAKQQLYSRPEVRIRQQNKEMEIKFFCKSARSKSISKYASQ